MELQKELIIITPSGETERLSAYTVEAFNAKTLRFTSGFLVFVFGRSHFFETDDHTRGGADQAMISVWESLTAPLTTPEDAA